MSTRFIVGHILNQAADAPYQGIAFLRGVAAARFRTAPECVAPQHARRELCRETADTSLGVGSHSSGLWSRHRSTLLPRGGRARETRASIEPLERACRREMHARRGAPRGASAARSPLGQCSSMPWSGPALPGAQPTPPSRPGLAQRSSTLTHLYNCKARQSSGWDNNQLNSSQAAPHLNCAKDLTVLETSSNRLCSEDVFRRIPSMTLYCSCICNWRCLSIQA